MHLRYNAALVTLNCHFIHISLSRLNILTLYTYIAIKVKESGHISTLYLFSDAVVSRIGVKRCS